MRGYAVFDVETTGFNAGSNDRIVELAVVHVDNSGTRTGEWVTLINPERDLGPVHIHGIKAADVLGAPTFKQVASTFIELVKGRVPVAHNLSFDVRFVNAELSRLGVPSPLRADDGLCTMRQARDYLQVSSRSLAACCAAADVTMSGQHEALNDARAAAALLGRYIVVAGSPPPWHETARRSAGVRWPSVPRFECGTVRRGHASATPRNFLTRLAYRLPSHPDPDIDAYLALLDEALLDRYVSLSEADALVRAAESMGIDRIIALAAHRTYLADLAKAAWADGVVTEEETADLCQVAELLSLTKEDARAALTDAAARSSDGNGRARFLLRPGDTVVFTGSMERPRGYWETAATAGRLVIGGAVTKKTTLVVAADPDTLSGKAAKARVYGIPIVTETAFARMLDQME